MSLRSFCLTIAALLFAGGTPGLAADWPQWRGPQRNAVSQETGLLREWPETGPAVLWQVDNVGVGYSSLVVADGRVITQGDLDGVEHVIAYSEKYGSLLWAVQPDPVAKELAERVATQFARFDKNGDGKLDELEAMSGLGWNFMQFDPEGEGDAREIATKRVEFLFEQLDRDGDGNLSFTEVPGAMQQNLDRIDREDKSADAPELAKSRTKQELANADKDGDGKVTRQEARGTLLDRQFNRIDEKVPGTNAGDNELTAAEIEQYFRSREPGRDGLISKAELIDYYARNNPGRDGVLTPDDLRRYYGGYRNSYGDGPRGTPTVDGDRIFVEGGNGDVTCLEAATGKTVWHLNLVNDLGGGRPGWGYTESPLVVGDWLIVTPGGNRGTLAALDKRTGEVIWRSTGVTQAAHYSSPQVAEIGGIRQIVQFARESVFGVRLEDGKLLWSYSGANNGTANIATPIIDGDYVLASSAYGKGAGLVKISTLSSEEQKAEEVYFQPKLANHHGGIVKIGNHVYGFGGGLVCMNFLTGDIEWQSRGVGKCSLVAADGRLYLLGENYEAGLAEASPEGYSEHGRFKIEAFGRPSWAHPVVANGKLFLRNMQRLTAYDVSAK